MRPPQVQIDFGTPPGTPLRTSSEFEEIPYPVTHPSYSKTSPNYKHEESLPLHHMNEDTSTRRRVARGPGSSGGFMSGDEHESEMHFDDDDDGKDVYSKLRPARSRVSSGRIHRPPPPPPTSISEFIFQNLEHLPPVIYTLLSRTLAKFGSHYLKREFYFDVHPPLGKMLGYNGHFEFKSGVVYDDNVPYVAMRVMMATFGVALVPLGWYTAVELGMSSWCCHLVALMVLCDVAWLCISRFILLDSMLLFFTFTTVFLLTKFHNQQYHVKWIGLFVTAVVGLYTIEDLWEKFGDLRMTNRDQIRHWAARVLCLIVLPILVYMLSFKLHFMILNHSGPGDSTMSSLFQAHLVGNDFGKNPREIAFGSKITLKGMGWGGGLLHSHVQTYPVGSGQQQITCYHYKDDNNHWTVLPTWEAPEYNPNGELQFLQDGDVIRLQHVPTTRHLHSHTVAAPVTKLNNEVSGYGNSTVGDFHDYWVVEVVDDIKQGTKEHVTKIHSLTTRLRFKHRALGCYLYAANAVLPQWGFKQLEVSCTKENNPEDIHTYWNVESHWNDRLPSGDAKFYRSPFLRDFWHLNVAMMTSNNALVPDPDKEDILASTPTDWPWLRLGLRMCGWGDDQTKYYLLGTPVIWWSGAASLIVSVIVLVVYLLRHQRKYVDMTPQQWDHFLYVGKIAGYGWLLALHALPTLYFSVLMLAHLLDHFIFSARWKESTKRAAFGICAFLIVGNFWWFRGMAWGIDGPINDHWGLLWRKADAR
ncbi:glycosyltransferase family 39 protein [Suillus subalutaceus]|uniref:glycosyltransferase family 39 protein n=1 Tax=Suillus subalutaceus TaxID=48586 RepID=UPI001B881E3D|nr:glycosyltransferase family 39 protein [Suillus subalutaceus]KAG1863599.1 glycosyltransferase family 39 protein [Suillus subalutaceus]